MIPATTPTYILTLKDTQNHLANTQSLRVDIRQQDVLVVKHCDDCSSQTYNEEGVWVDSQNNKVYIFLTQKETVKFLYKKGDIEFQLHGLMNDGKTAWKTYVVSTPVDKTLSKEVIT